MNRIQDIEARREAILQELRSLRSLRRGTINEQFLEIRLKGEAEPVLRGPYYVLSRREGGKTVSQRLTSPESVKEAQKEVASHQRFLALCREFEQLTERLGEWERASRQEGEEKKKRVTIQHIYSLVN